MNYSRKVDGTGQLNGSRGRGATRVPAVAPTPQKPALHSESGPTRPAFPGHSPTTSRNGEYSGRVIAFREDNGHDDSDFYALVEESPGEYRWIGTGSTRHGGGWIAHPDAADDVRQRYADWYEQRLATVNADRAAYEEARIREGRVVEVRGGRKHTGKVGVVAWVGEDKFRSTRAATHYRARIRCANGETFYAPADYLWVQKPGGDFVEATDRTRFASQNIPAGSTASAFALSRFPRPVPTTL